MDNTYLRMLCYSALCRINNNPNISLEIESCYLNDSLPYINFNNSPSIAMSLLGTTFFAVKDYALSRAFGYCGENPEGSNFRIGDHIRYQKIEDSSVYSKEFADIIRLILLSEYLENNLVAGTDYAREYREDGERYIRDPIPTDDIEAGVKMDLESIVLEQGKSLIMAINNSECGIDMDKMLKAEGYTIISRFRDNTIEDLTQYYGDKIAIKVSKSCYFINGKGIIFIAPTRNLSSLIEQQIFAFYKLLATKSSQTWFYKNKEYLLSFIKNEKIKGIVSKIIMEENDDELNELSQNVILDIFKIENKKINRYYKKYMSDISNNTIENYSCRYDMHTVIENIKADIRNTNRSITDELKEAHQTLRNLTLQLETLESSLKKSGMNPEVSKAIKYLEKMKATNIVRDYFIDSEQNSLVIHTNWLRQKFVELNNLNKRYLNDYVYENYRSILDGVEDSDKYIKSRNECIESILNYEDKYSFVIMPATIVINFSSVLNHGIGYEYFTKEKNPHSLKNGHSKYFSAFIGYKDMSLTRGCLGSSESLFNECSCEYNLTKYISLLLQYLQTFIPIDSAGDYSLLHNPIIDNEGKVISYLDDVTVIGKYINENPAPEARAFIDKEDNEEEEDHGN